MYNNTCFITSISLLYSHCTQNTIINLIVKTQLGGKPDTDIFALHHVQKRYNIIYVLI